MQQCHGVIEPDTSHMKYHSSLIIFDQVSLTVYTSLWSPSQPVGYDEIFCSIGKKINYLHNRTHHHFKRLAIFWHFSSVANIIRAKTIHKLGVKCQLLHFCDYTGQLLHYVTIRIWCRGKSPFEYGVPYWYGDACTHMVILRVWILTHIYIYIYISYWPPFYPSLLIIGWCSSYTVS